MGTLKGTKQFNFNGHGEKDRKDSWYWNVLVKNMGSLVKAKKAVHESRDRVDPLYNFKKIIRI